MTPDDVGKEIAKRTFAALSGRGIQAVEYPSRGELPVLPCILLHFTSFRLQYGMREQRWHCVYTGQILVATADSGTNTYENEALLNSLLVPLADLWDASNSNRAFLMPGVKHCTFQDENGPDAEIGVMHLVNNKLFYGGSVTWTAEFIRFAGDD